MARDFDQGRTLGPRVLLAGIVDGKGPNRSPTELLVDDEASARVTVDRLADAGFVQVKVYNSLPPRLFPVIVEEAHRRGLRVSGHVPDGMKAADMVSAGADEIQHAYFVLLNFLHEPVHTPIGRFDAFALHAGEIDLDGSAVHDFATLCRQRGVDLDLTLISGEQLLTARPGAVSPAYAAVAARLPPMVRRSLRGGGLPTPTAEVDRRHRAAFAATLGLAARLYRAGVTLDVGTDETLWGFSLARELELYVQAGLPPAAVLQMATLGAARIMRREGELGAIVPGARADLVLVDGDPVRHISDVRRPTLVVARGRLYDPAALDRAVGIAPFPATLEHRGAGAPEGQEARPGQELGSAAPPARRKTVP